MGTAISPFKSFANVLRVYELLEETIQIVERRLKEKTSADPMADLAFLISEYKRRGDLYKADEVSKYMLRLAEGESPPAFEVTPLALHDPAGALEDANRSIAVENFTGRQLRLRANAFYDSGQKNNSAYAADCAALYTTAGSDI